MNEQQRAAIERLRELEKQATPGLWEFDTHESSMTSEMVGIMTKPNIEEMLNGKECDVALACALRNEAMPLIEALAAENERLRQGLKDMAAKFAEMEKLRSQFYTEKEQAETALLFANRENERLRAGIKAALSEIEGGKPGDAESILEALHDA